MSLTGVTSFSLNLIQIVKRAKTPILATFEANNLNFGRAVSGISKTGQF